LDPGEARRVSTLFPEGSAVVDADGSRVSNESGASLGAMTVVDSVANLFLLFLH
jgi:hypothetical protein